MDIRTCYFLYLTTLIYSVCGQAQRFLPAILAAENNQHLEQAICNILKPRVVGTPGHEDVLRYITSELESLPVTVEKDSFVADTPIFKNLTFTNIVAKFNPNADEFLALACHYDSKYFPDNPNFVGAIDSAVPCGILLNLMKVLAPHLEKHANRQNLGLMLIFFDGEEAFLEWKGDDNLYGSKHLATKMSSSTTLISYNRIVRDIDRIQVLVLLDLIGAKNPKFFNFDPRTQQLHSSLVQIERQLARSGKLTGNNFMFLQKSKFGAIDDDHRPFLEQGVPVVHLIDTPFPPQWHTADDDEKHLHWPSIVNFNNIFRAFVYNYFETQDGSISFRTSDPYNTPIYMK